MESGKECKVTSCYRSQGCKIFGIIFLVVATVLTLITLNGAGILGMFIVGVALMCCHKKTCGCNCKACCGEDMKECMTEEKSGRAKKI